MNNISTQADRARILANGAASRHRTVKPLRKLAVRLTALELLKANQKIGRHYTRAQIELLRAAP